MSSESVQVSVQAVHVPGTPTKESQVFKWISHLLWSCNKCDMVWRSYYQKRCPGCYMELGTRRILSEKEESELFDAVHSFKAKEIYKGTEWHRAIAEFHRLLQQMNSSWYDLTSRIMIQACYESLCKNDDKSVNFYFAIKFFKNEYETAEEEENTFGSEEENCPFAAYAEAQCELQIPGW